MNKTQAQGMLFGLAIGDALGAALEPHPPRELRLVYPSNVTSSSSALKLSRASFQSSIIISFCHVGLAPDFKYARNSASIAAQLDRMAPAFRTRRLRLFDRGA